MSGLILDPSYHGWLPVSYDTPFDPRVWPSPVAWWDPGTGTTHAADGGGTERLSQWVDRIAAKQLAPATADNRPILYDSGGGRMAVSYSGFVGLPNATGRRISGSSLGLTSSSAYTILTIGAITPGTANATLLDCSNVYLHTANTTTHAFKPDASGSVGVDIAQAVGGRYVVALSNSSGGGSKVHINGFLSYSGAGSTATLDALDLGPLAAIDAVDTGDVVIWGRQLSDSEIYAASVALAAKYPTWVAPIPPEAAGIPFAYYSADGNWKLSSGTIEKWGDSSPGAGLASHVLARWSGTGPTQTATNASYNNRGTFGFASGGADRSLRTPAFASDFVEPATIYFVGDQNGTGVAYSGRNGTTDYMMLAVGASNSYEITVPGHYTDAGTWTTSTKKVICCVFNGASSALFATDMATAVGTLNSAGAGKLKGLTVGGYLGGGAPLNGQIAAILIYSGAHDATTRAAVAAWLVSIYG